LAAGFITVTGEAVPGYGLPMATATFDTMAQLIAKLDAAYSRAGGKEEGPGVPPPGDGKCNGAPPISEEAPPSDAQGGSPLPSPPKRKKIGTPDKAGYVRVDPERLIWAASHLPNVPLQLEIALAANSQRQHERRCRTVLPRAHMLRLPGRGGRPRSEAAIDTALAVLKDLGRQMVVVRERRPRRDRQGEAAERDLPWLHLINVDRLPRPKLQIARAFLHLVEKLPDVPRRLLLLLVSEHGLEPGMAFAVSPEVVSRTLAKSLFNRRGPTPRSLRAALRELVAGDFLAVERVAVGCAPGWYRLGPRTWAGSRDQKSVEAEKPLSYPSKGVSCE